MSFYSPIDRLAQNLPRPKGTGSEFMTELSKMPGYKSQEAEDRGLQALVNLPKMERAQFLEALKTKRPVVPVNSEPPDTHHETYTLPGGDNYREILLQHPQGEFKGVAHHFGGAPNVLASVRVKDRTGPNGEKILHIEELQSDWHQQGREKGYGDTLRDGWKFVEQEPGFFYLQKEGMNMPMASGTKEEVMDRARYYGALDKGVPNAPFKKNWHEMALKKMIHHAAANGYDSIAITPGAEQAKRYGLAEHIGMMSYNPEDQHFQAFKPNRETAISERGATPERVSELVGKELAQKLMAAPKQMGHHYIEGEDLNIGGEGMKGFYDKIVPNFLNQFGKKYGAKVGAMHINVRPDATQMERDYWKTQSPKTAPVHHFPITPAMREDVTKNGVPLYSKGGDVKPVGYTKEQVTVSPNLDAMRYELKSVKHYTKKAK